MSNYQLWILHTDNGGKCTFKEFSNYLKNKGPDNYEFMIPKNSEQNGVAGRLIIKEFWYVECIRLILIVILQILSRGSLKISFSEKSKLNFDCS